MKKPIQIHDFLKDNYGENYIQELSPQELQIAINDFNDQKKDLRTEGIANILLSINDRLTIVGVYFLLKIILLIIKISIFIIIGYNFVEIIQNIYT